MAVRRLLELLSEDVAPALVPAGATDGQGRIALTRPILLVGSRADAHVRASGAAVAALHAVMVVEPGAAWVRDLASRAGTFVNDRRVREARLRRGDVIRFGDASYRFETSAPHAPDVQHAPIVFEAVGTGQQCRWDGRVFTIGRREGSDLMLADEAVSLIHAVVCVVGRRCYLSDARSRTGTFLNGVRIRQIELLADDQIKIGPVTIRTLPPAAAQAEPSPPASDRPAEPPANGHPADDEASVDGLEWMPHGANGDELPGSSPALPGSSPALPATGDDAGSIDEELLDVESLLATSDDPHVPAPPLDDLAPPPPPPSRSHWWSKILRR